MATDRFEGLGGARPYREAAAFYADNRPVLSTAFVRALAGTLAWTAADRILDLGTGPAQVARRIAPHVGEVVAVDPEADMLAEGRARVAADGLANVTFVRGGSDDLSVLGGPAGQFRAVTIGYAFHWMVDQDRVLRDLDGYLDPVRGAVVIVQWDIGGPAVEVPGVDPRPWREREPWRASDRVLDRYLADVTLGPRPDGRHDPFPDILGRSAFSDLALLRWEYERTAAPSAEAAIGYRYSVSHVLAALGDRRAAYEAEVREAVAGADTSPVRERVVDSALIGRRPPAAHPTDARTRSSGRGTWARSSASTSSRA